MNRKFFLTTMSRVLAVLSAFACIAVSLVPGVPAARGAGAIAIAVISPQNSAGVAPPVLSQVAQALYEGVVATGRYDVKGGGPINVQVASDGDATTAALAAASQAEADQVLITDVLRLTSGKIIYRMTIYKVSPVTFGRSQIFQQVFPASDAHAFAAQFGNDLATLEAPRTNTGTIFAVGPSGIQADTGEANGFHLGQRFNVVRSGKKVAEAQITQITGTDAVVEILNPSPSYQPEIGDLLISQEPGPAIPTATENHSNNGALDVLALLVGVGAALLAIGHNGSAATVNCPPPTPSGAACVTASPTGTGAGSFTVALTNTSIANPKSPIFTFNFSKPVLNASTFAFGDVSMISVTDQIPPAPPISTTAVSVFAGATANCVFDGTGMVLTCTVLGQLVSGHVYFINFSPSILATDSTALTPNIFRYPPSGTIQSIIAKPAASPAAHAPQQGSGTTGAPGNNGSGGNGGANGSGPKAPQPHGNPR